MSASNLKNVQHITPAMHVMVQHAVRSGSSTMTNDKKPNHSHEHFTTTTFIKFYSPSLSVTNNTQFASIHMHEYQITSIQMHSDLIIFIEEELFQPFTCVDICNVFWQDQYHHLK